MTLDKIAKSAMRPLFFMLLFGAGLAGCNTMEGFGEDVESGGEEVQEQAD